MARAAKSLEVLSLRLSHTEQYGDLLVLRGQGQIAWPSILQRFPFCSVFNLRQ